MNYALINADSIVEKIIVADDEFISSNPVEGHTWLPCDQAETKTTGRASIGDTYSPEFGGFVSQSPFPSWILDGNLAWQPPLAYPQDGGSYRWDETNQNWLPLEI